MKLLNSLYSDICSLRLQLLLLAVGFNVFVILNRQPPSVVITAIGLLATCYGWWFQAKNNEVKHKNKIELLGERVNTNTPILEEIGEE